jgi:hypothetical protein
VVGVCGRLSLDEMSCNEMESEFQSTRHQSSTLYSSPRCGTSLLVGCRSLHAPKAYVAAAAHRSGSISTQCVWITIVSRIMHGEAVTRADYLRGQTLLWSPLVALLFSRDKHDDRWRQIDRGDGPGLES